ncbi:MAG: carboxypeptidase-like regulatory domain-containing protein [Spirosomataceae bacterium]
MKKLYWLSLYCLIGMFYLPSFSQTNTEKRITANFNNSSFEQFVKEAEAQTGVYFYYPSNLLDSLKITLNAQNQPLIGVLIQVFKGTDFKFAIDNTARVFVTTDQALITELPTNLFDKNNNENETEKNLYVAPTTDEQDKLLSTAESKTYNIGPQTQRITEGKSILTGYVRNANTGEPVIGASVYIESPAIGASTDALGLFSLTLPRGKHTLRVKSIECARLIVDLCCMAKGNWIFKCRSG